MSEQEDIEKYLRMLGLELQKKQVTGELLVGGAVMLLEVGNREVTKDIDAYFEKLHISNAQEVFALVEKYTKKQKVEARVQYLIEEFFDS